MPNARIVPIRSVVAIAFAAGSLVFVSQFACGANNTPSSVAAQHRAVQAQFAKAEEQRSLLNSKPVPDRTLADFKQVVNAYRRVTLITSRAPEVADALIAIAELNTEMGDRFGRSYFQAAVETYQFLIHEYPKNRFCPDALLRIAHLQKDQLGDGVLASKTYQEFLKRYPRSPRRREAQEALAELALLQQESAPEAPAGSALANPSARNAESARPAEPSAAGKPGSSIEAPRLTSIASSTTPDSVRITIQLEGKAAYSSARIVKPDRIYFDIYSARLAPELVRREIHGDGKLIQAVRVAQNHAGVVRVVFDVAGVKDYTASLVGDPPSLVIDFFTSSAALRAARAGNSGAGEPLQPQKPPTAAVRETLPIAPSANSRSHKSSAANSTSAVAPGAPQPTRDGQATLTRALGLKIGRIVIDPGHGGHDTGTIGPTGLMEKDLCLDVALRLGQIIEQRLPGAEVIYTRSDDSFIPLEERTQLANDKKADLFLSIHANSSRDHATRGVETYYLNLKGSPEAMEVAARENATAQENVSDLQELVKKIARNEKIEESRELAEDIQDSLTRRIQKTPRALRNRGVRKAPFVVLIGANMPSVLAEISFLSNPGDELLLKKGDYRQRLAEGLYQGVVNYLQSLNSVTYNLPSRNPAAGRSSSTASAVAGAVEQSRNQQ